MKYKDLIIDCPHCKKKIEFRTVTPSNIYHDDMYIDYEMEYQIRKKYEKIINEAIEECKSVIGNPEHTIVSKNELMKIQLKILQGEKE